MIWALVTKPKLLNDVKLRSRGEKVLKINIKDANKEIQKETGNERVSKGKKELEGGIPQRLRALVEDPNSPASTHKEGHNHIILVSENLMLSFYP